MQILLDIPNEEVPNKQEIIDISLHFIAGKVCECNYPYIVFPKGHGRLIDADVLTTSLEEYIITAYSEYDEGRNQMLAWICEDILDAPTIIEADKEYEVEVVTRGNCMICGKELTEGLLFCKECEDKASSRK